MLDIKLCTDGDYAGDLDLTDDGDIQFSNSLLQNAKTAILWISDEWRLGPDIGLPWFDEILVKNQNTQLIQQEIRNALMGIDGVENAEVELRELDRRNRKITFQFSITADGETYSEEVTVGG